jgi:hypothetical protein
MPDHGMTYRDVTSVTYSRYAVHLLTGTLLHLHLTDADAETLIQSWIEHKQTGGSEDLIWTRFSPQPQSVMLSQIVAIVQAH